MMSGEAYPVLNRHLYWVDKSKFQLTSDIYEEWIMFVIESGKLRYRIGVNEGQAGAGDLVVCPPQVVFEREVLAPVTFHFLGFAGPDAVEMPNGRLRLSRQERLRDTCEQLQSCAADRSPFSWRLQTHLLQDLWLQVLQEYGETGFSRKPEQTVHDVAMIKARTYLAEHASEPLHLKDVAALFHLTPVQFTRRFHAAVGERPLDCLTELRLERACRLLTETDSTIDAIARSCGYENGFYLSRVFTKRMGMNPTVYRKKHRV